jgi:hypothetical protein
MKTNKEANVVTGPPSFYEDYGLVRDKYTTHLSLKCAACGHENTHQSNVIDTEDGIRLPYTCEACDAVSFLDIVQHKGWTELSVGVLPNAKRIDGRLDWLYAQATKK